MDIKKIVVFTDGSASGHKNKRKGGFGVFFSDNHEWNYSKSLLKNVTNQRAELFACLEAVRIVKKKYKNKWKLLIYSDSMYTINCITKWAKSWEKNNWTKKKGDILNLDIIKPLYRMYNKHDISFKHVNSHQKEPSDKNSKEWLMWHGNDEADKLATSYMSK